MKMKPNERSPIWIFILKHKWRIILPLVFSVLYWSIPAYRLELIGVQSTMFFKAPENARQGLDQNLDRVLKETTSDANLSRIAAKYELFKSASNEDSRVEKLRRAVQIRVESDDYAPGAAVISNVFLRKEDSQDIAAISEELLAPFRSVSADAEEEFVTKPYEGVPYKQYVIVGSILRGLFLISIPLIFLWETPNIFYSERTQSTIFQPIRADWERELVDAKLAGDAWAALRVNVRYSVAFLTAMFAKSPIGGLAEGINRIVS